MKYPYQILSVSEQANDAEIRSAYLKMVKQFPPEADAIKFQEITGAYNLIKDEISRARLKVFGVPQDNYKNMLPSDFIAENLDTPPLRPGIDFWLKLIEKENND